MSLIKILDPLVKNVNGVFFWLFLLVFLFFFAIGGWVGGVLIFVGDVIYPYKIIRLFLIRLSKLLIYVEI